MRAHISVSLFMAVAALNSPCPRAMAQVIPPDLPPGTQYQLIFVTMQLTAATSMHIADYNAFVTEQAGLNPSLPQGITWNAIGTASDAIAKVNAPWLGLPVYNTRGQLVASASSGGLYVHTHLNPVEYDQFGNTGPIWSGGEFAWTGSFDGGGPIPNNVNILGGQEPWIGNAASPGYPNGNLWLSATYSDYNEPPTLQLPMYALSTAITAPEPSGMMLAAFGLAGLIAWRLRWRQR